MRNEELHERSGASVPLSRLFFLCALHIFGQLRSYAHPDSPRDLVAHSRHLRSTPGDWRFGGASGGPFYGFCDGARESVDLFEIDLRLSLQCFRSISARSNSPIRFEQVDREIDRVSQEFEDIRCEG
jgi:hypothetical protein